MAKTLLLVFSLWVVGVISSDVEKRLVYSVACPDTERLHHARVVFQSSDGTSKTCGGTLIHKRWVITASHCYGGRTGSLKVELGGPMNIKKQLRINSKDIKIYAKTDLEEPIMLLKLPKSVRKIVPAVLPPGDCIAPSDGEILQVSGRGATAEGGEGVKDLMCLDVKILSKAHCPDLSGTSYKKHSYIYCGGGLNNAEIKACKGDSGSGLLKKQMISKKVLHFFRKKKRADVLYGVLVSGHDECEDKFVFVDLCSKSIKKWIGSFVS